MGYDSGWGEGKVINLMNRKSGLVEGLGRENDYIF